MNAAPNARNAASPVSPPAATCPLVSASPAEAAAGSGFAVADTPRTLTDALAGLVTLGFAVSDTPRTVTSGTTTVAGGTSTGGTSTVQCRPGSVAICSAVGVLMTGSPVVSTGSPSTHTPSLRT